MKKHWKNLPFKDQVEVEWKSFQLDPTLDQKETKTTSEYFKEKKGFPEAQTQQMIAQVKQMGSGAGIDFNFEKALITNTFSAHKLLHLAKKYNKANEMEEALFIAHFVDGKNVGDVETLVNLAGSLGIDQEEAQKVLASEEYNTEISKDITEAREQWRFRRSVFCTERKICGFRSAACGTFCQCIAADLRRNGNSVKKSFG